MKHDVLRQAGPDARYACQQRRRGGIDVDAAQAGIISGQRPASTTPTLDVLGNSPPHRSKPVVVVAHGDTWNLGHEIYLASDVRVASANTRFGQDENTHGRFPGGGATVRFVREAGWGNAMRYMLTGDHWTAEESYRMGITQQIAATPEAALDAGIAIARKIAACAPLSITATLTSAHQYVDPARSQSLARSTPHSIGLRTSSKGGVRKPRGGFLSIKESERQLYCTANQRTRRILAAPSASAEDVLSPGGNSSCPRQEQRAGSGDSVTNTKEYRDRPL